MKMLKMFVAACVLAASALVPVNAKSNLVSYSFEYDTYRVFDVEYTEAPCEEHWYGTTLNWDGHDGTCEYSETTIAAAKAGKFSPRVTAVILNAKRMASGKFGSPVAILD